MGQEWLRMNKNVLRMAGNAGNGWKWMGMPGMDRNARIVFSPLALHDELIFITITTEKKI
jgi:hypothetical protein